VVKSKDESQSPHLSVQEWTQLRDRVCKEQLPEVLARVVDIALRGKDKDALAACNTVIGWHVGNVADETRRNTRSSITLLFSQVQQVDGQLVEDKGVDILDVTPTPTSLLDDGKAAIERAVARLTADNDDSQSGA
jgi:hypothetical protein